MNKGKLILKTGETIAAIGKSNYNTSVKAGLLEIPITQQDYEEIIDVIRSRSEIIPKLHHKIAKLKGKVDKLETYIAVRPGGQEYLLAEEHFISETSSM